MAGSTITLDLDPESAEFLEDPYRLYGEMRSVDPVFWSERFEAWFLLNRDDVVSAFRDPRLSSQRAELYALLPGVEPGSIPNFVRLTKLMVNMRDRPDHSPLRKLVNRGFTTAALAAWVPRVRQVVKDLLDAFEDSDSFDLVPEFAAPMPARIMAAMFDLPDEDHDRLQQWSDDWARFFGGTFGDIAEDARRAEAATIELEAYFGALAEERIRNPGEDMMSRLVPALRDGDITVEELIAQCVILVVAGHVTTIHQLSNGVHALLTNPEQLEILRFEPDWMDNAIEEMMRYDLATPFVHRLVTEDVEIGGKRIAAGQMVYLGMGPANRDPRHVIKPDSFDITRPEIVHTAFGIGTHACLGASLARSELQTGVAELLARCPDLALDPDRPPVRQCESIVLRGFESLPLRR